MPLDLFEGIKSVEKSPEFADGLRGSYLCSAISFVQPGKGPESWDLNYYNSERHEIATIQVTERGITHKGIDKPFKDSIPKLVDLKNIAVTFSDAFGIAEALLKEKHAQSPNKIFVSLHTEGAEIWSINFILGSLQIMQVKIDAKTKSVIDSKLHNLMQRDGVAS